MIDLDVTRVQDTAWIETETGWIMLEKTEDAWTGEGLRLYCTRDDGALRIAIAAPHVEVKRIKLIWRHGIQGRISVYGDHWERGYGDLEWRGIVPERIMPWYAMIHDGDETVGIGVRTGGNSFCHWQLNERSATLIADVRCGPAGVRLGDRVLQVADVVQYRSRENETPFHAAKSFAKRMCALPLLPALPVYGGNNWYCRFGDIDPQDVMEDAKFLSGLADGLTNRPYMVIDDGWQLHSGDNGFNGGPWVGNRKFPDMAKLARDIEEAGAIPGIWIRPLLTRESLPATWTNDTESGAVLDPSIPEALEHIGNMFRTLNRWGYRLIKHDFSTFDLLGLWGPDIKGNAAAYPFADRSRTSGEIVKQLYQTIKDASGDSLIMGCNTIGHLAAGLVHIQRTGDDTSGAGWERTRRMGINTLAFRMHQHDTFYSHDADCVAITPGTPWSYAAQWLDLVSRSGTPLFLSAKPGTLTEEQLLAVQAAFRIASEPQIDAVPLDWLHTTCPATWQYDDQAITYDWYTDEGIRSIDKDNVWWV